MTDSAPPEDASPPDPVARPATSRSAKLLGQIKRFRGPIAAIAAFGAVLSGFLGYWSAYQTVQKVVVPQPAPTVVSADAGPLSHLRSDCCHCRLRCRPQRLPWLLERLPNRPEGRCSAASSNSG